MYIIIMINNIKFDIPVGVIKKVIHHVILELDAMNKLNIIINIPQGWHIYNYK